MKKKIGFIACAIAIFFISQMVSAQTSFQGGINGLLGFPQGKFKDNAADLGGGIGLEFLYSPATSSFGIGAAFGFIVYGSETNRELVQTSGHDFHVDVSTTNAIIQGHILVRVQNKQGSVRPYLDGLLGFNHLTTDTRIKDPDEWDDSIDDNDQHDTAFSYGGGAGIMIKVYEKKKPSGSAKPKFLKLYIDAKVRYISGGEAEYLRKGSISRDENNKIVYDKKESKTDIILAQVGVNIDF